jgi:hypothetical protein
MMTGEIVALVLLGAAMPQRTQGNRARGREQPTVNNPAEPSAERWMNRARPGDDPGMAHLLNALCATVLVYAAFTRGGLAVARGLEYIASKAG